MIRKRMPNFALFSMIGGVSWYLCVEHALKNLSKSDKKGDKNKK